MSHSTWSRLQEAKPTKKQPADSMKQQNEAYQVRGCDLVQDKQLKRSEVSPFPPPPPPHLAKQPKEREFAKGYPKSKRRGLTASKLNIVKQPALPSYYNKNCKAGVSKRL